MLAEGSDRRSDTQTRVRWPGRSGVSRVMVAGDFAAVDSAIAAVLAEDARAGTVPGDQLALAWSGAAAVAGFRNQTASAEDAFATALRLAEDADDDRCAALGADRPGRVRPRRSTPARAIDDARRVLGAKHLSAP